MDRARTLAWRPWLRAFHRDMGYVAVGLTVVYALSGLAVNHIADWDPNFRNSQSVHELGPLGADAAKTVLTKLAIEEKPKEVYPAAPDQLEILLAHRTLHVNPQTGHVVDEGQSPRFLLRVSNWLHLNRGKRAWTYVADSYAVGLLFLAFSGMFMLPGRRGLLGRGAIFVAIGVAIPVAYVVLSGGP